MTPSVAHASGGGPGLATALSLMLAPVALLVVIVEALVWKLVDSAKVRSGVGVGMLVVSVLVALCQVGLIVSDVLEWRTNIFPTLALFVMTVGSLALTGLAIGWAMVLIRSRNATRRSR